MVPPCNTSQLNFQAECWFRRFAGGIEFPQREDLCSITPKHFCDGVERKRNGLQKAQLAAEKKKRKKEITQAALSGDQNLRCCSTWLLGLSLMGPTQHCVCYMWCLQMQKLQRAIFIRRQMFTMQVSRGEPCPLCSCTDSSFGRKFQ